MRGTTLWTVADNSGIKTAKQLHIHRFKRASAEPGDLVTVFPQKYKLIKKIARNKYNGLVLTIRKKVKRRGGASIQAYSNSLVIIDRRTGKFLGSKIFGPSMREMRFRRSSYTYRRILARIGYFI